MAFGSEQVQSATYRLDVDYAGAETLHWFKAPKALTVTAANMVAEVLQNAGTAVTITLENWGTAGTAVEGTIAPVLGGTAAAAILSALVPDAATPDSTGKYVDEGDWLVLAVAELGAGWVAGDAFTYTINYVVGKA